MNALLNGLFGLDGVGFGAEGVSVELATPIPGWAWALILPLAIGLAAAGYLAAPVTRWRRVGLGAVRASTLLLLALVLAGPRLVRPNERVEPDRLIVLADRSASLSIRDAGTPGSRTTRDDELRTSLGDLLEAIGPDGTDRVVDLIGFDGRSFRIERDASADEREPPASVALPEAGGERTLIGRAVARAVIESAGRPVAGVVLMSDGRSADAVSPATLRSLTAAGIGVFAVPLGSAESIDDARLVRVSAPSIAFEQDRVPVTVEVDGAAAGTLVEVVDQTSGRVLASKRLDASDPARSGEPLSLPISPPGLGERELLVRLMPPGEDLIEQNNAGRVRVTFVDRPVRVLYLEGYPRWEYRYLKNLLVREPSIRASAMLVSNRREYLQEGDAPIATLPESPEDWAAFDVVILGDLRPELLGERRLAQLRDHVAERGAGLIWIAGEGPTPREWGDSVLASLLPVSAGSEGVGVRRSSVTMRRTDAAARRGLFALDAAGGWPAALEDPATGWSLLRSTVELSESMLKPTSTVLAEAIDEASGDVSPLVVSMRFGAGRSVLVGTDETWRYRYASGEGLTERFWVPLIRSFGRESLSGRGSGAVLRVTPERPSVSSPVRVELSVNDQDVLDRRPSSISVVARWADGSGQTRLVLSPETSGGRRFAATWTPDRAGTALLSVDDVLLAPAPGDEPPRATVEVVAPQDEFLDPRTDHDALAAIASATRGSVVRADAIESLVERLPNRARRIPIAPDTASLWDRPVVLITLFALLVGEWLGRRACRLI
ncbi:MAG: hypothetical protein AAF108_04080 [Planctomycetota bacterium]